MIASVTSLAVATLAVVAALAAASGADPSRRRKLLIAIAALGVVFAPLDGQPAGRYLSAFSASTSVTTVCLLAAFVVRRWAGKEILDARALRAAWLFGGAAGLLVLPATLAGRVGLYALGWGSPALPAVVWVVTVSLIVTRNRFGLVLLLGVLAFDLSLLESRNLWDALVDPAYALVSLLALTRSAVRRAALLRPQPPAA